MPGNCQRHQIAKETPTIPLARRPRCDSSRYPGFYTLHHTSTQLRRTQTYPSSSGSKPATRAQVRNWRNSKPIFPIFILSVDPTIVSHAFLFFDSFRMTLRSTTLRFCVMGIIFGLAFYAVNYKMHVVIVV